MTDPTLNELLQAAESLPRDSSGWLLEASILSEAITESVMSHPQHLRAVKQAVKETAVAAHCDWIVGASSDADRIVRDLNSEQREPSRVLLFDLVQITGSTIHQTMEGLRHVDVVPAVLVDLRGSANSSDARPLRAALNEALGS